MNDGNYELIQSPLLDVIFRSSSFPPSLTLAQFSVALSMLTRQNEIIT